MNEYAMMGFIMYRTQGTGVTVDQINAVIEAYEEYKQEYERVEKEHTWNFGEIGEIKAELDHSYTVKKDNTLIELRANDVAKYLADNMDNIRERVARGR
ncbi:hypothetical protein CHH65_13875 [Shouchella clausii]|uniref:hypothetical protein n=1 Tax=Shouchella clausii TaxID=79880 RepID=UPI000BA79761|nr:hypothetical protein [Shouchella clausii]PAF08672.1 hypothetical protein CHH65_13875 [Shouchella clausii]